VEQILARPVDKLKFKLKLEPLQSKYVGSKNKRYPKIHVEA
jgi:hypothetical protein